MLVVMKLHLGLWVTHPLMTVPILVPLGHEKKIGLTPVLRTWIRTTWLLLPLPWASLRPPTSFLVQLLARVYTMRLHRA